MDTFEKILLIVFIFLAIPLLFGIYYVTYYYQPDIKPVTINTKPAPKEIIKEEPIIEGPVINNLVAIETPKIVKAIYITASSAKSQNYLKYLDNLLEETEINTAVIDIKDSFGEAVNSDLVEKLRNKGIYTIARIAVFQDTALAKARPDLAIHDKSLGNLSWVDPASKEVREYNISIAKNALSYGFDEINFDYIRFPSDGSIGNMEFPFWDKKTPMRSIIKEFFEEIREAMPDEKLSIDLFGYSAVSNDDMGIGQVLEDSFDYFDFIAPMIYPSHFKDGFIGYSNPAEYPYEVIKYSMQQALKKYTAYYDKHQSTEELTMNKTKFRPWLQDFNMGADYTAEMVKAEIKAVADVLGQDFNGFMLWNASNIYTVEAIK